MRVKTIPIQGKMPRYSMTIARDKPSKDRASLASTITSRDSHKQDPRETNFPKVARISDQYFSQ
jgi:hypothetical protein